MKPRPVQQGDWTGEEIDYLCQHWPYMTGGQIAKELGRTRNAVVGKAFRLELVKGEAKEEEEPPPEVVEEPPEPLARPRSRGLCNTLVGFAQYCPNTVQPGRAQCAKHLPKPKRTRTNQIGELSTSGASSMVW